MNLSISIKSILLITNGKLIDISGKDEERLIKNIVVDSRSPLISKDTLFVILNGNKTSGANFIKEFQSKGGQFILTDQSISSEFINQIVVDNALDALQNLAKNHREKFSIPVIGITGSNGKTTVKEWLYSVLKGSYSIIRSPKSYNSQLGVALSVLEINATHNLALFEAGISQPGEMVKLERMIQPTIGVFTGIGDAHNNGFLSKNPESEKRAEKFLLFDRVKALIEWDNDLIRVTTASKMERFTIKNTEHSFEIENADKNTSFKTPFSDKASLSNAAIVACVVNYLGISEDILRERLLELPVISMRLEKIAGKDNNLLINDAYNLDEKSLAIGLQFLQANHTRKRQVLFIAEDGNSNSILPALNKMMTQLSEIDVIYFGSKEKAENFSFITKHYEKTNDFFDDPIHFENATLLFTGSRNSHLEEIVNVFTEKKHITRLVVDFSKMRHNLNYYRSNLKPHVGILAMVKAQSYGGGIVEIASFLAKEKVVYFGVAYADEGVLLRKNGIATPILVMNPEPAAFDDIIDYNLEPSIYSIDLLNSFIHQLILRQKTNFPIHLKLDTGMNRLGLRNEEVDDILNLIKAQPEVFVRSVFSHLAASDSGLHNEFTLAQIEQFKNTTTDISEKLGYSFIKHIGNSSGALNYPASQFDMVRIGIGLFGLLSKTLSGEMENVLELHSQISQIRMIKAGESVGYSRDFIAKKATRIGIVPVGYADGLRRKLGNGKWHVIIAEKRYPIIGKVCMDMCMIDLGEDFINAGTNVQLFGDGNSVFEMSEILDTIPYEIISSISARVKRVYLEE